MQKPVLLLSILVLFQQSCLPPADPYPDRPAAEIVAEANLWSAGFEAYIKQWMQGSAPAAIPDGLIPEGISDSKNFYLKNPDQVTPAETWAVRYARPINKDSLLAGIPDPKITYLFLGTALAPFGSKMVVEGEFPHCRFFSVQVSPPLNGKEYYAQRQFGTAEVSIADVDIEPMPGSINPFRVGADRTAANRKYRLEFDLVTGDPTSLNEGAHDHPYRKNSNSRKAALLVYQGPLGHKTIAGTPLANPGDWNLGCLWLRIYGPDDNKGPLGGVPMPKVWFELPTGEKYFIGSDFSALQKRADSSIPNRVTAPNAPSPDAGPQSGWFKSWGITRSILNGVCLTNGWSRPDSGARVNQVDLGWTGRGEFQAPPGNIEPHATTNNYATYLGRSMTVAPGYVAVLTGKMPTFPQTRNGEPTMTAAQVRYWSICGIDQDPLSPLPATTIHGVSDDDVVIDAYRNYVIAYSRPGDRPANATSNNGVTWVDWGTQSTHGLLMRWVCLSPEWTFSLAPQEHHLDWAHSDWAGSQYDSTLLGVNWRNGFMQCYLPKVHYMTREAFEALGNNLDAEKIPVWVDESYKIGPSEALLGAVAASSVLNNDPENAATNVNDGDYATAWSSEFGQQNAAIAIDLGSEKVISAIKLYWDWIFFAKHYTVETSKDNVNWTTVAAITDGNGQIDLFQQLQDVRARYVRLNLTLYNAGWYRLGEFEVYTNDCRCDAPVVSTAQPRRVDHINIFPNPVIGQSLYYTLDTNQGYDVYIFDQQGRQVHVVKNQPGSGQLLLPPLPAGVYQMYAAGKYTSATGKFVML